MIAALYVQANGVYFGLPNVDPWDEKRDARLYAGPWPVVAHPPCSRWSLVATFRRQRDGKDGGCFMAALDAVERWGGVLEHPAYTLAFKSFGLPKPPAVGWQRCTRGGWVCSVDQGHFGHPTPKPTWLYFVGREPPRLPWTDSSVEGRHNDFGGTTMHRRSATPIPFRDVLIAMAEGAAGRVAA